MFIKAFMQAENLILLFDLLGSAAFALSGALVAVRKQLDLLGIIILALVTAVGGGITRDLLVGVTPPGVFQNQWPMAVATVAALLTFIFYRHIASLGKVIDFFDAIGLGIFTMAGIQVGVGKDLGIIACLFLGALTGAGGGVIRDILANRIPYVLKKEMYASASLLGGCSYFFLKDILAAQWAAYATIVLIIVIRLVAMRFNWHLPTGRARF